MFYISLINKDKFKLIICCTKKSISLHHIVLSTYIENVNSLFYYTMSY